MTRGRPTFSREQILIGVVAMGIAGLTAGSLVALTVRSEEDAKRPTVPTLELVDPDGRVSSPSDTPSSTLTKLWSLAQWGDVPAILTLQDPAVRRAIGDQAVIGVYEHQRTRMVTTKPRVLASEIRRSTATVRYRLGDREQRSTPQSAILRRCGASWCMRYDTFIAEAIPYYVIAKRGGGATPSRGDRVAGAEMAASYRALAGRLVPLTVAGSTAPGDGTDTPIRDGG
ncbi:MAG TPA: hypothetical protein VGR11_16365 [Solirubrobacteraceae bacterium]|nr:hypothetical protein [Solirubrobacteraceae bacterium]